MTWDEVPGSDPAAFTLATVPDRFAAIGDPWAGIDDAVGSLDGLLGLAAEQEAAGMADAPWPPHYAKTDDEPPRVQPSKRRRSEIPVVEIARAKTKDEALAGLERWKARHPDVVGYLEPADVLVDAMRGRFTTWTRVRVRLTNVPEALRPGQEPLEVDYDPSVEWQR
jgi:hypothetical protein